MMKLVRKWLEHRRPEHEFLPAVIEIERTPPSPMGRIVLWAIMAFLTVMLVWSYFGKIDVVAVAPGKIVPSARVKTIQSLETAVIKEIRVREGDLVSAGEVVFVLDDGQTRPDVENLKEQADETRARLQAVELLLKTVDADESNEIPTLTVTGVEDKSVVMKHKALFNEQWLGFEAGKLESIRLIEKTEAEINAMRSEIKKLSETLPIAAKRADSLKNLWKLKAASEMDYLNLEQQRIEMKQNLERSRFELMSLESSMKHGRQGLARLVAENRTKLATEYNELSSQLASIESQSLKAVSRNQQTLLRAPVDGYIQGLAAFTEGGVVRAADVLANIVPQVGGLEIEAFVDNKDIGSVEVGQEVTIKLDAFDFTKYGVIKGKVELISKDSQLDEKKGLIYAVRISFNHNQKENQMIKASPGMSVVGEIVTRDQTIFEFFINKSVERVKSFGN